MKKIFFLILIIAKHLLLPVSSNSQSVAINHDGSQPNPRALLDLKSTSQGLFLPRMTSAQRLSILVQSGDAGLFVFDTDKQSLYMYTGVKWVPISFNSEKDIPPINMEATDPAAEDYFGYSVDIDGDYAVIGAYGDDIDNNINQGSVYVFYRTPQGWMQQVKLTASDGSANDWFGTSVAISGDRIVVGATNASVNGNTSQGAAYVFVHHENSWTQETKLTAADGEQWDGFGRVAIDSNRIVVGAPNDAVDLIQNRGSVYVFTLSGNGWVQTSKLLHSDGNENDFFGNAVAIRGNTIVAGAYWKEINGIIKAGSAYVFKNSQGDAWSETQKLFNYNGQYEDYFGSSVAIDGDKIIVGIPGRDKNGIGGAGQATIYFYNNNAWVVAQNLFPFDPIEEAHFGTRVDIAGEVVMIGAPNFYQNGLFNLGAVYVYERPAINSSWIIKQKINNSEPAWNTYFGMGCALDKHSPRYIIGSYGKNSFAGEISFGVLE